MSEANKTQVGGEHWVKNKIQTWDYIIANGIGYMEGNVIKYVTRWRDKNGIEDLKKARHYLDKLIESAMDESYNLVPKPGAAASRLPTAPAPSRSRRSRARPCAGGD